MPLNDRLRPLWKKAGYSSKNGSAAVVPPPPATHWRLYYLTSAEFAISNVVFRRLKVGRFSQLNDPYELLSPHGSTRSSQVEFRKFREKFDQENGVLCFSADWVDPVLWSHYADRHRGMCLGFDVKRDLCREVKYTDKRLELEGFIKDSDFAEILLCSKFKSWEMERERRVLVPLSKAQQEGDLYFLTLSDDLQLKEVILGTLCRHAVSEMRSVVEKHHQDVVVFASRLAHNSFNVVPNEWTLPEL